MAASPKYGSPLYVFTDATAKDYTKENLEEVLWVADETGITINFFTTGLCGRSSYEPFEKNGKRNVSSTVQTSECSRAEKAVWRNCWGTRRSNMSGKRGPNWKRKRNEEEEESVKIHIHYSY